MTPGRANPEIPAYGHDAAQNSGWPSSAWAARIPAYVHGLGVGVGVGVGEAGGQLTVGIGLGEQALGLLLECVHGVCSGREAERRFVLAHERDQGGRVSQRALGPWLQPLPLGSSVTHAAILLQCGRRWTLMFSAERIAADPMASRWAKASCHHAGMTRLPNEPATRRWYLRSSVGYLVVGLAFTTGWWWEGGRLSAWLSLVWFAGAIVLFVREQRESI